MQRLVFRELRTVIDSELNQDPPHRLIADEEARPPLTRSFQTLTWRSSIQSRRKWRRGPSILTISVSSSSEVVTAWAGKPNRA
jgi:hypothetical protein